MDLWIVLVIILVAVIVWRGPKTLPQLGRAFGRGVKEAREEAAKAQTEIQARTTTDPEDRAAAAPSPAAVAPPSPPPQQEPEATPAAAPPTDRTPPSGLTTG
jgi:Sec-independent protein translocase protein TatA